MIFKWTSDEERLRKWMKISPQKKMEWLRAMHELIVKSTSKREKKLRVKLREMR